MQVVPWSQRVLPKQRVSRLLHFRAGLDVSHQRVSMYNDQTPLSLGWVGTVINVFCRSLCISCKASIQGTMSMAYIDKEFPP